MPSSAAPKRQPKTARAMTGGFMLSPIRRRGSLRRPGIAEAPSQAGAQPVVAAGIGGGWLGIPVAVERQVVGEVAEELHVECRVGTEEEATRVGKRGKGSDADVQVG